MNNINDVGANNQTILIVDDNATNLKVLTNLLEDYGFTLLVARDGLSAIETAQYAQPDLILLDVMMPGLDGFATCERLKEDINTEDIPVIFMTALNQSQNKVKGFQVGAVDYVTKPLQHAEVIARVTTHLRVRALSKKLQDQNDWLMKLTLQQETINQIGQEIIAILQLDQLLTTVVKRVQSEFEYDFVGVWLLATKQNHLSLKARAGQPEDQLPQTELLLSTRSRHMVADVFQNNKIAWSEDISVDSNYIAWDGLPNPHSQMVLPLRFGNDMLGVLDIQNSQSDTLQAKGKMILRGLANQIAIAIRNAKLYGPR